MNIVGIIQARIGSKRLPLKMMLSLNGHPIIKWVVERVKTANLLNDTVIAIPNTKDNNILDYYLKTLKMKIYRGSEENVLKRIYEAAKMMKASHVVRICADNPFIAGDEIDNLVDFYCNNSCDYAYNHIPKLNNYPNGFGAEIVSYKTLEYLYQIAKNKEHLEHCFTYIHDNPTHFSIKTFNVKNQEIAYPDLKLDVDTFNDYFNLSTKNIGLYMTTSEIVKNLL